jgi:hypothetical protein
MALSWAEIWAWLLSFSDWIGQSTNIVERITGFLTAILALGAALAAFRGRSPKHSRPRSVPKGTGREAQVRLPELRAAEERQDRLVRWNSLAGTWLLPLAVVTATICLVSPAVAPLMLGSAPPWSAVLTAIVGLLVGLCWFVERRLAPEWRAKQALERLRFASTSRKDVEDEVQKLKSDPRHALNIAQIEEKAIKALEKVVRTEAGDRAVGV